MKRYKELLACWKEAKPNGCRVLSGNESWEGERWVEWHRNGDYLTMSGQRIPLSTEFLVCKKHEPEGTDQQ